ncbi:MAG: histidine phosphatase family protein [Candidatus Contendobacter sp.]|nr:histidine phosphatase family protein [Candidatus Contendobacter sp.]MDS4030094.1 histidine phosphatase family protein [Candidatus Contendobacter sp.]
MKLLLVRHAIAEEAEAFIVAGGTDAQRPLTEVGRKKMRKGANRLRSLVGRIDVLAHSPLLRARETAEIIARACGDPPLVECASLDYRYPPETVADWLTQYPADYLVVAVGHEPQLGLLAGLLVAGESRSLMVFRKGGVAMIEFPEQVEAGMGVLHWALTAGQLRGLKQD